MSHDTLMQALLSCCTVHCVAAHCLRPMQHRRTSQVVTHSQQAINTAEVEAARWEATAKRIETGVGRGNLFGFLGGTWGGRPPSPPCLWLPAP